MHLPLLILLGGLRISLLEELGTKNELGIYIELACNITIQKRFTKTVYSVCNDTGTITTAKDLTQLFSNCCGGNSRQNTGRNCVKDLE